MNQASRQAFAKKAAERPCLDKQKLPSEKPALSAFEKEALNRNLLRAVKNGRGAEIKELLNDGVDINAADERGRSALTIAAGEGNTDICVLLLDYGARQIRAALKIADMNTWYKIVEWTGSSMRNIAGSEKEARKTHGSSRHFSAHAPAMPNLINSFLHEKKRWKYRAYSRPSITA
jgi:ankyrin repeat protein